MAIAMPIETERLLIRPFVAETDTAAMVEVYGDADVMHFVPGGALAPSVVGSQLAVYEKEQAERGFSFWAIVERESGRAIGDVGFGIFAPTGDVEVGYTLARDRWGRGYATEAVSVLLAAGLAEFATRIVAVVDSENEASLRVVEKIGMTRVEEIEAHGRPHILFATG